VIVVIPNAAKDLVPVASGDEVLRYAQDDRSVTEKIADHCRRSADIRHNIAQSWQRASLQDGRARKCFRNGIGPENASACTGTQFC
jgi:hypothetical protein